MTTLTAEQRLTRAIVWLMNEPTYAAFSGLYLMGKTEIKDGIPTACTNGRDEFYGREFVSKLTDQEVRGLKLHETWHKAARHLMVWKHLAKEDPRLANMAMDYVINLFIRDSDPAGKNVKLPNGALLDEKYRGMDVGEVYKLLKEQQQGKKNAQGNGGGKAGASQTGAGEQGDGDEQSNGGGDNTLDQHDWDSADSLTAEEEEKLAGEIDQALRQGALIAGKLGAKVPRELGEMLAPKVDWREVLRDFVGAFAAGHDLPSYRKPNRRMMSGNLVLPSHISETVGKLVIAVDTSGSIFGQTLTAFLAEVVSICETVKPESVELLYWDTAVAGHEKYEEGSYAGLLTSTKPVGGGGTTARCIPQYLTSKAIRPECVVILTDGYIDGWGEWSCPTLWCITEKRNVSPVGKSVYMEV